jgi:hypothetical protein
VFSTFTKAGIGFALLSVAAGVACRPAATAPNNEPKRQMTANAPSPGDTVPGEYIITTKPGADAAAIRQAFAVEEVVVVKSLGGNRYLVAFATDPGAGAVQQRARDAGTIESTQPNFRYRKLK